RRMANNPKQKKNAAISSTAGTSPRLGSVPCIPRKLPPTRHIPLTTPAHGDDECYRDLRQQRRSHSCSLMPLRIATELGMNLVDVSKAWRRSHLVQDIGNLGLLIGW